MKHIIGYRAFEIVKTDQGQPFRLRLRTAPADTYLNVTFPNFESARHEVDYLMRNASAIGLHHPLKS
jgi:CYTH domain-containing protein